MAIGNGNGDASAFNPSTRTIVTTFMAIHPAMQLCSYTTRQLCLAVAVDLSMTLEKAIAPSSRYSVVEMHHRSLRPLRALSPFRGFWTEHRLQPLFHFHPYTVHPYTLPWASRFYHVCCAMLCYAIPGTVLYLGVGSDANAPHPGQDICTMPIPPLLLRGEGPQIIISSCYGTRSR